MKDKLGHLSIIRFFSFSLVVWFEKEPKLSVLTLQDNDYNFYSESLFLL